MYTIENTISLVYSIKWGNNGGIVLKKSSIKKSDYKKGWFAKISPRKSTNNGMQGR
jgi:hypothetical protein